MFDKLFKTSNKNINGLTDELQSIYVYDYYLQNNKPVILVTSSLYEANKLYQSLLNYTENVLFFPMDDFLTSVALAASPELKTNRIETINKIIENNNKIIVTNLMGFLRFLPPKKQFIKHHLEIKVNDEYDINWLAKELVLMGYKRDTIVTSTGEFALRGFVLDIFPIGSINPIRMEFFGDSIEEIREFNSETQLTIKKLDNINVSSNTELLFDENVENSIQKSNLIEYLGSPQVFFHNYSEIETNYQKLCEDIIDYNTTQNKTTKYMYDLEELKNSNDINISKFDNSVNDTQSYISFEIEPFDGKISTINTTLNDYINEKTVIICLSSRYQINKIVENLDNRNIVITDEFTIFDNKINLIIKSINEGFNYDKYIVISEKEFFNKKETKINYKNSFKFGTKIRDIKKIEVGDYIVHNTHGIGRYVGIKTLIKNGLKKDYLVIEYKDNDKLYIPVEKIELISKYSSNDNVTPKINKLGSTEWAKTKLRVKKKLENIASELLELYAKREASVGFAFNEDDENQIEFEKQFIYEDTLDQVRVTEEIKKDMEKPRPMDRLLCGDVGYGKTEIAFRAMFKAVLSGKQVAYLCPTTILSSQHYNNAIERFKEFPINIRLLNRFVSNKEIKETIEGLKTGKIDIVIGTHRLLSDDIVFKNLGLLVIDEEQRFGVKHKEKIKSMKNNIDVLTLSATPIPRTLQMSMLGIRNLSLLETPPVNRLPVQTYVLEENNFIIKDAIYKELSRSGQAFILYNSVEDMELKKLELEKLIPEARITYAHGKMSKTELENVMTAFINKEYDVLLCTTIIETGIDIPSANTLIIIDADRFGLSQLYQIRGRVGRSNKIAYCYLMYKKGKTLSDIANKRLSVIKEFTELGSGFRIAARDLSIRGAGDILGSEQAGFIDSIGIELYLKMLNEEVNKLKGIETKEEVTSDQPLIDVETTIDDKYVEEVDLKIEIHKKINEIDSYDKLLEIKGELEDRFGNINESILIYMYEEWFEKLAHKFNITKVRQTNNFIELTLPLEITNKVNGELLFIEASRITRMFRFKMVNKCLVITLDTVKLDKHFIFYLIELMELLEKAIN